MKNENIKAIYGLSPLQEGMLYHRLYSSSDSSYHIQNSFWVNSKINFDIVKNSLELLTERHEVLKTAFIIPQSTGKPWQVILKNRKVEVIHEEHSGSDTKYIDNVKSADLNRGFDLQKDSLFRITIVSFSENKHFFLFSFHHIIIDGWCISLVYGDFLRYYEMLNSGVSLDEMKRLVEKEKDNSADYKDYIMWLGEQDQEKGLLYWQELLVDYEGNSEIKSVMNSNGQGSEIKHLDFSLPKEITKSLVEVASSQRVTINTVAEAAWGILLQSYNHSQDVVFGKVVSGRNVNVYGIENTVGLFINTIPARIKCENNNTVDELLRQVQTQGEESSNYDFCSLASVQALTPHGSGLIKTLFVFENYYMDKERLESGENGLHAEAESEREETNYDVTISVHQDDDKLIFGIIYNTNKYAEIEMQDMFERLKKIFEQIVENPHMKIGDLDVITDSERTKILNEFNNTFVKYPSDKTIIELFEHQVEKTPEKVAVVFEDEELTYKELNKRSNQLAYRLRELEIGPDDFVAIIAKRSTEAVVGICGILKSGGAYVPIDATYPEERIKYVLKDSKAKALLTYNVDVPLDIDIPIIDLSDSELWIGECVNLSKVNKSDDLAYCIYTSGTTGDSKGVLIEQKSVLKLVKNQDYTDLNENTVILQTGQLAFDASTFEIWGSILNGGRIHLINEDRLLDFKRFKEYLIKNNINTLFLTTALFNQMIRADETIFDTLEHLMFGGEKTSEQCVNVLKNRKTSIDFRNVYGPTETTTFAAQYIISDGEISKTPIGKPISNTQIYILRGMKLSGIGIPGELCIAGPGLARGYLNRQELTTEKFIDNPYGEGRLYRSGDLVRWLPEGNIEYIGRIDEQVKIRGFRIELGEILGAIRGIQSIKDTAVITREDENGEKAIYAYLVSDENLQLSEIRKELRKVLPEYMVPSYMVQIDKVPMTRNGKLDKRALPEIEVTSMNEYVPPRNETEKAVCKAFELVLGAERIGIKDSFFEMGGDSIKAIRIVSKMRELGYEISIKNIMEKYTAEAIADTAMILDDKRIGDQGEVTGEVKSTPIMDEFASWNLIKPNHFNQDILIKVESDEEQRIHKVLNALAIHHDILRSVYRKGTLEILNVKDSKLYDFKIINLKDENDLFERIDEESTLLQSEIDLENGPLMKSALFKTKKVDYLFICIHHLVVDGVSWRIILEDFETGMKQLKDGKKISFPSKTASFKEWSEALEEYKDSSKFKNEKEYWGNIADEMHDGVLSLEQDGLGSGYGEVLVSINEKLTSELVRKAGKAFNTEINDLLICAISMAVKKLTGQEKVSIGIEGHGRENLHRTIDVDRTVGWFTSIYPFVTECLENIDEAIITVKERLRRVPNHGIGYGIIRKHFNVSNPDICFNYLGQMDAENNSNGMKFCATGRNCAIENTQFEGISINGIIESGVLNFSFSYSKRKYSDDVIKKLARLYEESLKACIEYCSTQGKTIRTPSDYLLPELTISDMKLINNSFGDIEDMYPLTPLQEGMLYHNAVDSDFTGYIIQHTINLEGEADEERIISALKLLTIRHSVLRTAITYENLSKSVQVVLKDRITEYERIDLTGLDEYEQNIRLQEIAKEDVRRGFDLQRDTLVRVKHVILNQFNSKMIWSYHHIIIDGWCMSLVYGDYIKYYNMLEKGISIEVLEKEVKEENEKSAKYQEYLKWLSNKSSDAGLNYWKDFLDDYEEVAEIKPMQEPEPTEDQIREIGASLSKTESSKLLKMATSNKITINTVIEAAWGLTLQKYNHTNDVVFGKVVSGRNADVKGIESIVGLFINTIPVRVKSGEDTTVTELLKEVQEKGILASNNSYCSLAEIQGCTSQKNELIKTLFVFENYYLDEERLKSKESGLQMKMESGREQTNYPISVIASFEKELFKFSILYDPNLYVREDVEGIIERTLEIIRYIVENPDSKIMDIETTTDKERAKILGEYNNTGVEYPADKTIIELFEQQVEREPENIAVVFGDEELTYTELNRRSNKLAYKLRELGVQPDDFVAIIAKKSTEAVIGILGILKSGGAYVPIDETTPGERIKYILKDCTAKAILVYQVDMPDDISIPIIDLTDSELWMGECINPHKINKSDDLAYCIYTSGTTGQPKGVMIENYGVANLREYFVRKHNVTREDRILQFANYAFDASVSEFTLSLLNGATLYVLDDKVQKDFILFEEFICENKITMAILPPQYLNQIDTKNSCLRTVITAGSETTKDIVEKNSNIEIYSNDYGPTEVTVCATYWKHKKSDCVPNRIPIGKPIVNKQVYILNGMKLSGIGIPGELCIGGSGLARGYLNRTELTAEKFIYNPYGEGKIYRTGDLARWLPDGNIEYLGRIDEQVKIRGFRIELGEIEGAIRKIDFIKDTAVITREDANGDKAIYAYLVANENVDLSEVRKILRKNLLDYMVPAYMTQIDEIPVTRNGKLDKHALPEIGAVSMYEYVSPRNEAEKAVCKAFKAILGAEHIGIKDNFFELGGDSIKAIRIVSKMREVGYEISIKNIMEKYTIEAIAETVKTLEQESIGYQGEIAGNVKSTPIMKEFISWNLKKPNHFNQDILMKVDGNSQDNIQKVLNKLAIHHDVIRSVYRNEVLEILSVNESKLCDFKIINLEEQDDFFESIEAESAKIQSSIDLENGPLMKSALFETPKGDYLFICLHHLIVDGVSWRILLEDFETGIKQLKDGKEIVLPSKTASFKEWSEALEEYKDSSKLRKEHKYWEKITTEMKDGELSFEHKGAGEGYGEVIITIDENETSNLIRKAGRAYNTEINDLLISALGMAVKKFTGKDKVTIGIEGHGREILHRPLDIDRTVGWFTCVYPFVVECFEEIDEAIISNKERLRKVPNHGIGYGIIKEQLNQSEPDIRFNYLGQMDAENRDEDIRFCSTGRSCATENSQFEGISINGVIVGGTLNFSFSYGKRKYYDEAVKSFAKLYQESLKMCIEYCSQQKKTIKTASDYLLSELTISDMKLINSRFGNIEDMYPLTPLQEGMLYHNITSSESTGYTIQHIISLTGKTDEDKIIATLRLLLMKHSVFRTVIAYEKLSKSVQVILQDREAEYEVIDLIGLDEEQQNVRLQEIAKEDVKRGFDLQNDTLIRIKHVMLDQYKSKMIWCYHHIIIDGWCMSLVYGDYIKYYNLLENGTTIEELEALVKVESEKSSKYQEYLKWLSSQDKESGMNYWRDILDDYEEIAEIKPMLKPEPTEEQMKEVGMSLLKNESSKLLEMASRNNITINTVAEAAWGIALQQYNYVNDVVFGKVVSGRNAEIRGIDSIVGLFINTIPVRVKCSEDTKVIELLKEVQESGISSNNYSYCPLAEIQGCTKQKHELIKTLFVFENYYLDEERLKSEENGLQMQMESGREQTNYPITVTANFANGVFNLRILYDPNIYVEVEMESILERIMTIMCSIVENPNAKISDIDTTSDKEHAKILGEFNNTFAEYPEDKTIMELFEQQVERTPENIAVVFGNKKLTYRDLNTRSNQLAYKLKEMGIGPEDFVAIIAKRSTEAVTGVCGILKSGGAYVPIDSTYPIERIRYILKDCGAKALLIYNVDMPRDIDVPVIDLSDSELWVDEAINPPKVSKSNNLAYCIYTSGTTGQPKGAMIEQKSVIKLIKSGDYTFFNEDTTILQTGQLAFDASTFEIWGAILNGGRVHLIDEVTLLDRSELKRYLINNKINTMFLTVSLYNQMITYDMEIFDVLEHLIIGGEKVSEYHVNLLTSRNKNIDFRNGYGPTETTTFAAHYNMTDKPVYRTPIGKPLANTQLYVLNGMKLCGIGIPGELCIAGKGVARGYLNRPELTAKKFVDNPYNEGRLYRSGDLVRWMPDGNIEYLGRMDEQVKIRGFRIELEEIEKVIRKIDYVKEVAVISREDSTGEKSLCAYLVSGKEISISSVKEVIGRYLPEYMVPAYIMQVEFIPVTSNGKLDKRKLPEPNVLDLFRKENQYVVAQSNYEKQLAIVWQNILNIDEIGIYDNFFELGGNSILLVTMQSQIEIIYPGCVKIGDIFANPTIKKLAEHIELKNQGVLYCEDIQFPEEYFNSSSNHLQNNKLTYRDSEELYQKMKTVYASNETEFHAALLMAYCYLLANVTEQKKFMVCEANGKQYSSFDFDMRNTEDLNICKEALKQSYSNAQKYSKINIQIQNKQRGVMPIFLYQFDENDSYKDFSDFSISFYMEPDGVIFSAEVYNRKLVKEKVFNLLDGFITMLRLIF